jgi:UDP-glucose:(heptosyl)LPS alpha-1,3-glucosyltransferase
VYFLGSLADIAPAYAAASCLAHPTHEDTFAMVVLEAMAHGLPVVVSAEKYCGIAGLLRHGRDALLLENPLDSDALAGALLQLTGDIDLSARLQSAGLVFATGYQWPALAQKQADIYQALVAQNP